MGNDDTGIYSIQFFQDHLSIVLESVNNTLLDNDAVFPTKILALTVAQAWCNYSTLTFIPNNNFISTLLGLCDFKEELCPYAFECLETLLQVSNHIKKLSYMTSITNYNSIDSKDREFLR